MRLLKRSRSATNRVFAKARRGDVVILPDAVEADIPSDAVVERISVDSQHDQR